MKQVKQRSSALLSTIFLLNGYRTPDSDGVINSNHNPSKNTLSFNTQPLLHKNTPNTERIHTLAHTYEYKQKKNHEVAKILQVRMGEDNNPSWPLLLSSPDSLETAAFRASQKS